MLCFRRGFVGLAAAAIAASLTFSVSYARTQDPLPMARILVGYPPGGFTDATARIIADALQPEFAEASLVENRPGAGGRLAMAELQRRPADGSNMLLQIESILTLVPLVDDTATVTLADVQPVAPVAAIRHAFAVGPMVPTEVRTLNDFLSWAKANPNLANFGTPGVNTSNRFLIEALSRDTGVKMNHIPYKGSGQGIVDLLGGQLAAMSSPIGDYLPYMQDGRLRVLGLASETRSKLAPDVPTFVELGFPDIVADETAGIYMLVDTSPQDVEHAAQVLGEIMRRPEVIEALGRIGLEPMTGEPAEYAHHLQQSTESWQKRVESSGFKSER